MSNFKYIYLDMDGVIVNFIGGVIVIMGEPLHPMDCWDFGKWWGVKEETMWRIIQPIRNTNEARSFWTGLQMYDWGYSLIDELEQFNLEIILTTTPSKSSDSLSGKMDWIGGRLPQFSRSFIMTPCKEVLSKKGILIDDSDANIEEFRERGGSAILFPQPWNKNRKQDGRVNYVTEQLTMILKD